MGERVRNPLVVAGRGPGSARQPDGHRRAVRGDGELAVRGRGLHERAENHVGGRIGQVAGQQPAREWIVSERCRQDADHGLGVRGDHCHAYTV